MTSYRKAVLKAVGCEMADVLPMFRRADFDVDVHRKRDALWVAQGVTRWYGLYVEYSVRRPGDFTGELVVLNEPGPLGESATFWGSADFAPEQAGIYRTGFLICGYDRWWQLRDHEEENFQFFRSLDPTFPESGRSPRIPHNWRPADFSISLEARIKDAAQDFVSALKEKVVPRLPLKT